MIASAQQRGVRLPDLLTVIAIALVAYAASNVVHEALGHGGACVALGGRPLVLSSVHFDCGDAAMGTLARRGVAAAGTIANFIAGALALVAFMMTNPLKKPHAAYFLWLFTTLNLLSGAGYFLFSASGTSAIGLTSRLGCRPCSGVPRWRSSVERSTFFLLANRRGGWVRSWAATSQAGREPAC